MTSYGQLSQLDLTQVDQFMIWGPYKPRDSYFPGPGHQAPLKHVFKGGGRQTET